MDSAMIAYTRTDEELLDAARHGDEGALAVLAERHRDRLERMAAAAWGSSTRPNSSPSAATWPSRCCPPTPCLTRGNRAASGEGVVGGHAAHACRSAY